jgi:hypothetical protein
MSLPSVYNTKKGGKTSRSSSSRSDPSPYAPKNGLSDEPPYGDDPKQRVEEEDHLDEADKQRFVPKTRLDQLLHTLSCALDSESTLNRSKWMIRSDSGSSSSSSKRSGKRSNILRLDSVVPPFPADMIYAPGVFGNVVARELSSSEPRPPVPPSTDYLYQAAVDLPQEGGPSLEKDIERDFSVSCLLLYFFPQPF